MAKRCSRLSQQFFCCAETSYTPTLKSSMKYVAMLSFLVLAGCKDFTAPTHSHNALVPRGNGEMLANYKTDFDAPGFLTACNGETVTMTGTIHIMLKETDTPNGGISVFTNIKEDLSGIGDITGLKYEGSQTSDYRVEQNGATVVDVPVSIRLISQGKSPNFFYDSVLHITFNDNGIVTAERASETTRCN
jgi:hypothetical protein